MFLQHFFHRLQNILNLFLLSPESQIQRLPHKVQQLIYCLISLEVLRAGVYRSSRTYFLKQLPQHSVEWRVPWFVDWRCWDDRWLHLSLQHFKVHDLLLPLHRVIVLALCIQVMQHSQNWHLCLFQLFAFKHCCQKFKCELFGQLLLGYFVSALSHIRDQVKVLNKVFPCRLVLWFGPLVK